MNNVRSILKITDKIEHKNNINNIINYWVSIYDLEVNKNISWKDILYGWKNGIIMKYPKNINERFLWNTSVLKNNGDIEYKQNFSIDDTLPSIQYENDFSEYINKSQNKYVTSFLNLSRDTMLVIPMPRKNKNYVTIKDFIDNASIKQQKEFWKEVANIAIQYMEKNDKAWISTHGHGVAYTHIRISSTPKYYFNEKLKKI